MSTLQHFWWMYW